MISPFIFYEMETSYTHLFSDIQHLYEETVMLLILYSIFPRHALQFLTKISFASGVSSIFLWATQLTDSDCSCFPYH